MRLGGNRRPAIGRATGKGQVLRAGHGKRPGLIRTLAEAGLPMGGGKALRAGRAGGQALRTGITSSKLAVAGINWIEVTGVTVDHHLGTSRGGGVITVISACQRHEPQTKTRHHSSLVGTVLILSPRDRI